MSARLRRALRSGVSQPRSTSGTRHPERRRRNVARRDALALAVTDRRASTRARVAVASNQRVRHPDRVASPVRKPATEADFFAIPEGERWHELFDSELVERAAPSGEHSDAQ